MALRWRPTETSRRRHRRPLLPGRQAEQPMRTRREGRTARRWARPGVGASGGVLDGRLFRDWAVGSVLAHSAEIADPSPTQIGHCPEASTGSRYESDCDILGYDSKLIHELLRIEWFSPESIVDLNQYFASRFNQGN